MVTSVVGVMLFSFCWILTLLLGARAKDGRTGRRWRSLGQREERLPFSPSPVAPPSLQTGPHGGTVLLLPHMRLTHVSFKVSHYRHLAQQGLAASGAYFA
jgi:hypothetical protein